MCFSGSLPCPAHTDYAIVVEVKVTEQKYEVLLHVYPIIRTSGWARVSSKWRASR